MSKMIVMVCDICDQRDDTLTIAEKKTVVTPSSFEVNGLVYKMDCCNECGVNITMALNNAKNVYVGSLKKLVTQFGLDQFEIRPASLAKGEPCEGRR